MNAPPATRTDERFEQGFLLGELRVLPLTGEVLGPGGAEKLDPKGMDVLILLAQHAGHVVPREDLLARLSKDAVVTDDALSRCIYDLRRSLSQAGGDELLKALIETVPKRGYLLNSEVTLLHPPAGDRTQKRSIRLLLSLSVAVALAALLWITWNRQSAAPTESSPPVTDTIAVLPFLDMSAEQDQRYLADGISEEILNRLTQAGNLRVISRTSSFAFRGRPVDIREIAAKLDVGHVLEGSVRKSGDNIRITAQLIAAADNSHLWSETFDRKLGDLFAIQDQIAASAATALQVTLAGGRPHGKMPASVDAYEHFLQGQYFYHRRAPGDIERSATYYEDAIDADPRYARAWAALAGAYSILRSENPRNFAELLAKQGAAARKAVELDPGLAVAHSRLAHYYYAAQDRNSASIQMREAAALDPNDPLVLSSAANDAIRLGDFDGAIALLRRAVAQDPMATTYRLNLAAYLTADGRLDEALAEYRKGVELSPNAVIDVNTDIVRLLVLQRRFREAQAAMAQIPEGKFRDHGRALLYALPARREEADAALLRLAAARYDDSRDIVRLADIFAFRGMNEQAFAVLQKWKESLARNRDNGLQRIWFFQEELRITPFLKPLHADPRWAELLVSPYAASSER